MRLGALICMAKNRETAKEFKDVMSVECRGSWSNGNRAAMTVLADIMKDEALLRAWLKRETAIWIPLKRGETPLWKRLQSTALESVRMIRDSL